MLNVTEARILAILSLACLTTAAYLHGSWIEALGAAGTMLGGLSGVSAYKASGTGAPKP